MNNHQINKRNPVSNSEGYPDPTVFEAMNDCEKETDQEKFCKLLKTIVWICDLAGFRIQGKLYLRNKKTGKVYTKN